MNRKQIFSLMVLFILGFSTYIVVMSYLSKANRLKRLLKKQEVIELFNLNYSSLMIFGNFYINRIFNYNNFIKLLDSNIYSDKELESYIFQLNYIIKKMKIKHVEVLSNSDENINDLFKRLIFKLLSKKYN